MADWQVGDLALCVKGADDLKADDLKAGAVYVVLEIWVGHTFSGGFFHDWDGIGLRVGAEAKDECWLPSRFRKITPGADIEGFEEPRRIPVKEKA